MEGSDLMRTRRRSDGWPFCPHCDEDELWCPDSTELSLAGAPLGEWLQHKLYCYQCHSAWAPRTFLGPYPWEVT